MVSTPEQRRRYRKKYPEKVKEQRIKYLDRKIQKHIEKDPTYLFKLKEKLLQDFDRLTRLIYKDKLPRECAKCHSKEDLHIHHKRYVYPIKKSDLKVLCRECHTTEHHKIHPPQK